jgi:8-oxo-dGTP pyrophosphatase MutT (NUDIX family)
MEYKEYKQVYCNNCGKDGHVFSQCKIPITSFGIILFRLNKGTPEYLMIRRKDTLGYIDFLRGKYLVHNKYYIMNMIKQMTTEEKEHLRVKTFDQLWLNIWGKESSETSLCNQYKMEEINSKEKFETLKRGVYDGNRFFSLASMIDECEKYKWTEPEWGFPKGRRNYKEKDYDCALREFKEETGYNTGVLMNFQNIFPFEEIFMGSNYKCYKHKYYLTYIDYTHSLNYDGNFQKSEVSKLEWKTIDECLKSIRDYNLEKKRLLINVNECLKKYKVCQTL